MKNERLPGQEEAVILEIRAAEGGDDAKDLVNVMEGIYLKVCDRYCL